MLQESPLGVQEGKQRYLRQAEEYGEGGGEQPRLDLVGSKRRHYCEEPAVRRSAG